jgi:hypothetical protein
LKAPRSIFILLGTALALLFASCGGETNTTLTKVFVAPPWTEDERLEYRLLAERDEIYGKCVLETELEAEPGRTRLNLLCDEEPDPRRDDSTALVDAATLEPISSSRIVANHEENDRFSVSSLYEPPDRVRYESDDNGTVRSTYRDLPKPSDTSPDPGYYDDVSLLWLVRGIELREGYEGSYQNIAANTGQTFPVDLIVEGQESVSVPAGEFMAWKIRIQTSSVVQFAWVDVEAPHRLVKANIRGIQDVTYELATID